MLGVAKGDRVAWLGPNHPAFLESLFAAGLLGAALAPVNHRLDEAEIDWILEDIKPRVLIQHRAAGATAVRSPAFRHVAVGSSLAGAADFEALIAGSPGHAIEETVGLDDLCLLPHTSGTTGLPKGVMLTHGNVTWNVVNLLTCADFRSDDVTIAHVPFFRVGGTGVNVLPVLFMGGTVVVPGDVHPDGILRLTEQHHVTVGFGNPDILQSLVRSPLWPTADLSRVRFLITGGAPVPEPLIRTYLERGLTLLQGYGLSEAAPVALLLQPETALSKAGSAGSPPLFVETKIAGRRRRCGAWPGGGTFGPRPERHGRVLEPAQGDGRGADAGRMAPDGRCGAPRRGRVHLDHRPGRRQLHLPRTDGAPRRRGTGSSQPPGGRRRRRRASPRIRPRTSSDSLRCRSARGRDDRTGAPGLVPGAPRRAPGPCLRDLHRPPAAELGGEADPRRASKRRHPYSARARRITSK